MPAMPQSRTIAATALALASGLAMPADVGAWPEGTARWQVGGRSADASLGRSCWTAGDVNGDGYDDIIVSDEADAGTQRFAGHAMVYLGSRSGPGNAPAWEISGDRFGSSLGASVRGVGDVNHDGFDDISVTAPGWSNGEVGEGRALVFLGSAAGLALDPAWTFEPDVVGAEMGEALPAGDVDGDGFDDLLVVARGRVNASTAGRAFVFLGSPSGLARSPAWGVVGSRPTEHVGWLAAGDGDVNGDGLDDIVIGTINEDGSPPSHLDLFLGSRAGLSTTPAWTLAIADAYAPSELALVGDVNGDGFGDLLEGAIDFAATDTDPRGRIRLFLGNPAGLASTPAFTLATENVIPRQPEADDSFGAHVAPAGDQDGDGRADFLVGAPTWGRDASGSSYLYTWQRRAPAIGEAWRATGSQRGMHGSVGGDCCPRGFGRVAPAGDVNGDGIPDVLIGAPGEAAAAGELAGRVHVFFGSDPPPPQPSNPAFPVVRLRVDEEGDDLRITWEDEWRFPRFNVHQGSLAALHVGRYDHEALLCGLEVAHASVPPPAGDVYWLVSSMSWRGAESSLGEDSRGIPAPPSSPPCR